MKIAAQIICIIIALQSCLAQDPVRYGEPECVNDLSDASNWTVGTSTPYYVGYDCGLSALNAVTNPDNSITLSIDATNCPGACSNLNYACGEAISTHTKFGVYSCLMQATGVPGTIMSCQATTTTRVPYESIFMAFIGDDITQIHIGFFGSSQVYSYGPITLGFDPTAQAHNYSFLWASQVIQWYVDSVEVATATIQRPLPRWPDRFLVNYIAELPNTNHDWALYQTFGILRDYTNQPATSTKISGRVYIPEVDWACPGAVSENPIQSPYTLPTVGDCSNATEANIYTDVLHPGWSNAGSTFLQIVNTTTVADPSNYPQIHSGKFSYQWTILPQESILYFHWDQSFTNQEYYAFEFWINGGPTGIQQINAYLILGDNVTLIGPIAVQGLLTTGIRASQWDRIVLPFMDFPYINPNASDISITGFVLSDAGAYGGSVFIDDVWLIQEFPYCANQYLEVYGNGVLSSAFASQSYPIASNPADTQFNYADNTVAYPGYTYSLQWLLYQSTALQFAFNQKGNPIPSKWIALSFLVYTQDKAFGFDWTVMMTTLDAGNNVIPAGASGSGINVLSYFGGQQPNGQWIQVVIPYHDFGIINGSAIYGVKFLSTTYGSIEQIHLDQIRLISPVVQNLTTITSGAYSVVNAPSSLPLLVAALIPMLYMIL